MKTGHTSFRALFGDGRRVEIPVIQRDYAQGRSDEHSREVRGRFLDALAEALDPTAKSTAAVDLDFVYGRWNARAKTLEPLDGQQRLTTLFLLHWYLACLDGAFDEFRSWMTLPGGGSCFTYRTRPAAREFFDALVLAPVPPAALGDEPQALSLCLTDAVWFVRNWLRDPTVRGCLTMFDAIHQRLHTAKGAWSRLVCETSPAITFHLLLLENFNLSDDLYVKMNARGKALTSFEVFKAEIERFVGEAFPNEPWPTEQGITWRQFISRQFDIAWTDFMWRQRGETTEIDTRFMHLIRAVAVVHCVSHSEDALVYEQIKQILATPEPGLLFFKELGCLDRGFVEQLASLMETLAGHPAAPVFLPQTRYVNEAAVFQRVLLARGANQDDGLTLVDWVVFCAWCTFLLRNPNDLGSAAAQSALHDWIRVLTNLAYNTDIDRHDRLIPALRRTWQLSEIAQPGGADFLVQVAAGGLDERPGFNEQQQREERLKALLILRDPRWRPLIERAETHPYFRGSIEFLLHWAGLVDRVAPTDQCDWDNTEDGVLRASFEDWYARTCAVFPETDKGWLAPFPEFLWERALLATGDYLLPKGGKLSLLDDQDRDASWRRLLRADTRVPDREDRRDVVRAVLAQVDPKDPISSLRAIVAKGVQGQDDAPVPGMRARLVAQPRLIAYCERRMLRLEEDSAFLLKRTHRNGRHDLYVYDLYLRLNARRAELDRRVKLQLIPQTDTHTKSQLRLRAYGLGVRLTAEKHGKAMQLRIHKTVPDPGLAARLPSWTADGPTRLSLSLPPDDAEGAIFDVCGALAACRT
ncbi:DUF262 domain-containing protein [uncultured Lamprocystis sp.]|jgi:hypothetical protein|uniref:DUF262 domain-containing protein n=1 Tax=uncultured Lamprocystis sp. TaxID=543132 RepID=UPI0025E1E0E2|nr:DUF262 domain-containing protein [uncultured Lamprocystis sp.]